MKDKMRPATELLKACESKGFARLKLLKGNTYKDQSVVMVMPTRGMIHHTVVNNFMCIVGPQNQRRGMMCVKGDEVGKAYNHAIESILACPEQSTYKYLMTIEDDNVVPRDAMLKLLESIEETGWDAMSGLYFAKGDFGFPMAFGDPERYRREGVFEFWLRDVREAVAKGEVMEVNGIAMGCAIWRMQLFKEFPKPWFKTYMKLSGAEDEDMMYEGNTQDLYFCEKMRKAGRRIGVDCRVKVSHLDVATGEAW